MSVSTSRNVTVSEVGSARLSSSLLQVPCLETLAVRAAFGTAFARGKGMAGSPVRLDELGGGDLEPSSDGTSALDLAERAYTTLRFGIDADPDGLEALLHARRALLREEWTLGLESDEPSLGEAVFSPTEIAWRVPQEKRERCLQKIAELAARAERARKSSPAVALRSGPRAGNTRGE